MDQKLTTKQGREAWVKKAVEAGVTEAEARDTMQKMVSASDSGKSAPKPSKPSTLGRKPKSPSSNSAGSLVSPPLPSAKPKPEVSTPLNAEISQLPLWPEVMRSLPNEILRSALFNARNRKNPRSMMKS